MSIRWRLLILVLALSLIPLLVYSVEQRYATYRLGTRLAAATRERLVQEAQRELLELVTTYTDTVRREARGLETAVRLQARGVEARLNAPPPELARARRGPDLPTSGPAPEGLVASEKHLGPNGRPVPVDYGCQAYVVAEGTDEAAVADDLARLSTTTDLCRLLHDAVPALRYWLYTGLESGLHVSYPAHHLPAEYDPRRRPWYRRAKEQFERTGTAEPFWNDPIVDYTTGMVTVTLSMPVLRGERFAGVTAIDMPVTGIFRGLALPDAWAAGAEQLLVGLSPPPQSRPLVYLDPGADTPKVPRGEVEPEALESGDPEELAILAEDLRAGRAGVREMDYRSGPAFWAYGRAGNWPAILVIVPQRNVIAPALQAEQEVLRDMWSAIARAGGFFLLLLAVVVPVSFLRARKVTRPIRQLADASAAVQRGDLSTRVDIHTGDELERLGASFNRMISGLAEREKLKHSLRVAMEIQQHLLPPAPPKLPGLDIVGHSCYCDETGGDYYDFIELVDLGPRQLGIALGDVTGHGIAAALLMASARGVLRSHAPRHGHDLSALFDAINVHLVRDTGEERFMTMFYGIVDGDARSLTWASAGHDPALFLRHGSGEITELPNTGVPLGIAEDVPFGRGGPVTMEPGDVILIGTDGIWETANPNDEMFGKDRLRETLRRTADATSAEIRDAVLADVAAFRGTAIQRDDITMVIIKAL